MSFGCVHGKYECDGCMMCEKEPEVIGYCAACNSEIYETDDCYDIDGDMIHDDCLTAWAEKFRVKQ